MHKSKVKYTNSISNDENGILKENDLTVTSNDLKAKGHYESQAIVAYIIVKYRNSISNDENGILMKMASW